MNTIRHLFKIDFRRFRWAVAGWIVAQIAVTALLMPTLESAFAERSEPIRVLLTIGIFVFWTSLLTVLVQSDAAYGGTAFWMTRPISALQLFCEKVLLAVVLTLFLPVAIHVGFLAGLGLTPGALLDAAAGIAATAGLFVPLVMFVAVLTRTFVRFWLVAFCGLLLTSVMTTMVGHYFGIAARPEVVTGRIMAIMLTATFGSLGLVWYLYASRSVGRALLATVALLGVLISLPFWWRWPVPFSSKGSQAPLVPAPRELVVSVSDVNCDELRSPAFGGSRRTLSAVLEVNGGSWPEAWRIGSWRGRAIWGDGSEARVTARFQRMDDAAQARAIMGGLGGQLRLLAGQETRPVLRENLKTSFAVKTLNAPVRFAGKLGGETIEYSLVGEVRPGAGESWRQGSARLLVKQVAVRGGAIELVVSTMTPTRSFTDATEADKAVRELILVLVNRRTNEAILLHSARKKKQGYIGVHFGETALNATIPSDAGTSTEAWLQDATLCVMATNVRERFDLPVEFSVPPKK